MFNSIRKHLLLITIFLVTFLLYGCEADPGDGYDHGDGDSNDFESVYADYFSTYDDCIIVNQDKEQNSYDYKEYIFNKYIIEHLEWENDSIPYDNYIYYAIKPTKNKNFTEFSIYIRGYDDGDSEKETTNLKIGVYKVTDLKDKDETPAYSDTFDANTEYLFDSLDDAIIQKTITVTEGSWNSTAISLKQGDNQCTTFTSSDYLLIVFFNNTLFGKEKGLKEVSFQATNIMICAKN